MIFLLALILFLSIFFPSMLFMFFLLDAFCIFSLIFLTLFLEKDDVN